MFGNRSNLKHYRFPIWTEGASHLQMYLFIYLGFYVAFNTVQVISRRVVGRAEETSTYSSLGFCTVNCRPTESNYQLSHLRSCGDRTPASEVGGESVTTLPPWPPLADVKHAVKPLLYNHVGRNVVS